MSKKNEKKKRSLDREIKHAKEGYIPILAALFFLVLGIIGIINNNNYIKEYNNSEDIRKVEAIVTNASLQSDNEDDTTWYVHLKYNVEGNEYNDTTSLEKHKVNVGETVTIEVYKKSNGMYMISQTTNTNSLILENVLFYASIVVGALIMAAGIFDLVTTLRSIKELQSKIQPDTTAPISDS